MAATYKDAGVDLDVYAESMSRLPRLMHRTFSPRVIPSDGGFAGLFQLDFAGKLFARNYEDPVLDSGTDGVGTKLKIAQQTGRHSTVGVDLVGMCVNDLLCTGAEPLFFLDYVAMGRDDPARLEKIVQGISDGCVAGDMALLGGETAIMPDMYGEDDYDLAGFAVGVVERKRLITGKQIGEGDVVLGVASSGLHSNGFSLVRKIIRDAGLDWDATLEMLDSEVEASLADGDRGRLIATRQLVVSWRGEQDADLTAERRRALAAVSDPDVALWDQLIPAHVAIVEGRYDEAIDRFAEAIDVDGQNTTDARFGYIVSAQLGQQAEAARSALQSMASEPYAGHFVDALQLFAEAGVAALEGRLDEALPKYRTTLDLLERFGIRFHAALVRMAALSAMPDERSIEDWAEPARERFEVVGSPVLVERLEEVLAARGGAPVRDAAGVDEAVT